MYVRQKQRREVERNGLSPCHIQWISKGMSHYHSPVHLWYLIQIQPYQNLKGVKEAILATSLVHVISELKVTIIRQHLWVLLNIRSFFILFPILSTICTGRYYSYLYMWLRKNNWHLKHPTVFSEYHNAS